MERRILFILDWIPKRRIQINKSISKKEKLQIVNKKAQGKKNRAAGARFELKVRKHFEEKGWFIDKWGNNIDLQTDEIHQAKNYYIPGRGNCLGSGFPDFVMFQKITVDYNLMLVECKINGLLSKEEKEKCKVYQDKGFDVFIAYFDETQENNIRLREYVHTEGRESIPRGL